MKACGHPHAPAARTLEKVRGMLYLGLLLGHIWCGPFKEKGYLLAVSEIETDSLAGQHITNVGYLP